LQREALRASQRKPTKGIVIPAKNEMENSSFIRVNGLKINFYDK